MLVPIFPSLSCADFYKIRWTGRRSAGFGDKSTGAICGRWTAVSLHDIFIIGMIDDCGFLSPCHARYTPGLRSHG